MSEFELSFKEVPLCTAHTIDMIAHERNPSNIAEMHECACRKAAEKHE